MSTPEGQMSREEEQQLRAQLEEEMKRITVDDLLIQTVVSMINLAGRKAGLAPGTEDERDLAQVKTAVDAVTALLPLLERAGGEAVKPIRDALAQLQMVYVREAGEPGAEPQEPSGEQQPPPDPEREKARSKLWTPPGT